VNFFFTKRREPDVNATLRELLLARAQGSLTSEEFEQRQAALHAAVLLPPQPSGFSARTLLLPAVIVATAAGLYAWLGNPKAIDAASSSPAMVAPSAGEAEPAGHAGDMNEMVKHLADKLAKNPKNGEGWVLLGRSYIELQKHAEAADAFGKAAALLPPDASLLADWADAYVMSHDRKWDKPSRAIVKRALEADPKHLKSLALAGSEAFDRKDYPAAIAYWNRMKTVAPADSMDIKLADANIQEATALMAGKPVVAASATPSPEPAASGAAFIAGTVTMSAQLKARTSPSDTVFIVAKSPDGSGPPLAVKRYSVADLPLEFRLDESAAMVPGRNLSGVPQALLLAKISKSGNAISQPGDIQTTPLLVRVGTNNAKLELGP
jgi:cytochrome c-type biogenesis protein CcmH